MCTDIHFFHTSYALSAVVKFSIGSPKRLGTNKFVRLKSGTGSKCQKIPLELLCTRGTAVVQPYCVFPASIDGATVDRQIPDRKFLSLSSDFEEG